MESFEFSKFRFHSKGRSFQYASGEPRTNKNTLFFNNILKALGMKAKFRELERFHLKIIKERSHLKINEVCLNIYIFSSECT